MTTNPDECADAVTAPSHYTQGNIECIDAMLSAFGKQDVATFCRLAAFKYVWRLTAHKDGVKRNTRKAIWFLRMSLGDDPRHSR
jgi:hypothetical protein